MTAAPPGQPGDPRPDAARERGDATQTTDAAAAAPVRPAFVVETASSDVDVRADSSRLPGQHRGGFSRLPTAPIAVTVPPRAEADVDPEPRWATTPPAGPQRGLAAWALTFAIIGLCVSIFVGWGFPIGLVAVVSGILALRRPTESRALAGWAIVLSVASLIYSAGWLWFAATQANLLG